MSNLLEKASIIHVPAGYDVGSINAVKPEYEVIDSELVTNNSFDTASDWNTSSGVWQIDGDGFARYDIDVNSTSGNLRQSSVMTVGEVYRVKIVVSQFETDDTENFIVLRNPSNANFAYIYDML